MYSLCRSTCFYELAVSYGQRLIHHAYLCFFTGGQFDQIAGQLNANMQHNRANGDTSTKIGVIRYTKQICPTSHLKIQDGGHFSRWPPSGARDNDIPHNWYLFNRF